MGQGRFQQDLAWSWPQRVGLGQGEKRRVGSVRHGNKGEHRAASQTNCQLLRGRLAVSSPVSLPTHPCPEAPSPVGQRKKGEGQ